MMAEFDILGVYVPALLVWALLALLLGGLLRRSFTRAGLYQRIWHPPLFDAAVFLLLLGGIVGLAAWLPNPWMTP
ncbi:MAG: hypothetical protein JWP04_4115 [Belnapia sp.]|jgi:hypothetical protein|nr:hypothetical protein [Belnapia sp.]